jgi:glyoxylase I family protein
LDITVTGLDHLYLAVSDFERSVRFYDGVMRLLGFRKGTKPIAGEPHVHYFNQVTQLTLRPARAHAPPHDPYQPGLHHLCFRVGSNAEVDAAARALRVDSSEPRHYPEYSPDYYATFFRDPDGIRHEIVAQRRMRTLIRERWSELTEFEDPITKAGLA